MAMMTSFSMCPLRYELLGRGSDQETLAITGSALID